MIRFLIPAPLQNPWIKVVLPEPRSPVKARTKAEEILGGRAKISPAKSLAKFLVF